jgi:hypothetical protein
VAENKDLVPRKETIVGEVVGAAAGLALWPLGLAKGTYHALKGERFVEGFSVCESAYDAAKKFGNDNSDQIKAGATSVASGLIVAFLTRRSPRR